MLDFLIKIVKKNKSNFIIILLNLATISIFNILIPKFNSNFIDKLTKLESLKGVMFSAIIVVALSFLITLFTFISNFVSSMYKEAITFDIKLDILNHLRKIPLTKFLEFDSVYLTQRINQDVNIIVSFLIDNFANCIIYIIQTFAILYLIIKVNIKIGLSVIVLFPLYFLIYSKYKNKIYESSKDYREVENNMYQKYNQQFRLMEEIRLEANYEKQNDTLNSFFKDYLKRYKNFMKITLSFNSIDSLFSVIFNLLILCYGGYLVLNEKITIGNLLMISNYFGLILVAIKFIYGVGKSLQIARASYDRLLELNDISELKDGNHTISSISKISFNIDFNYNEKPLFNGIKSYLNKGEVVGIVGKNGKGKSTLVKLLVGLLSKEDSKNGSIDIKYNNSMNLEDISKAEFRKHNVSFLNQKVEFQEYLVNEIFRKTIEDVLIHFSNRNYKIDLSTENFLKEKWNTPINTLSVGDRQFLGILKCFMDDKDLIIFDEPTSNLDHNRTNFLKMNLSKLKINKIILIISHDQNLEESYDKLICLDKKLSEIKEENETLNKTMPLLAKN